jgi:hypothetical protein
MKRARAKKIGSTWASLKPPFSSAPGPAGSWSVGTEASAMIGSESAASDREHQAISVDRPPTLPGPVSSSARSFSYRSAE